MWRRLLVVTGLAALVVYFLRRRSPAPAPIAADPAEKLRRKLDETRGRPDETAEPADDLDDRRKDVHDRARAAADEMRGSAPD